MKKEEFSILVNNPLDCEYIQKLAFKAGYGWKYGGEQSVKYKEETGQLFFRDKKITREELDNFTNPEKNEDKTLYSFPKDAVKIHELFNTPEYKVGDYVVLVAERPGYWSTITGKIKFLGSTQEIKSIGCSGEFVEFGLDDTDGWGFYPSNIARHATEDEIKAYKEGDDIYIGGYRVEYYPTGIKVGCKMFSNIVVKGLRVILGNIEKDKGSFMITRDGVNYQPQLTGKSYYVTEETLSKIIKRIEKG